MKKEIEIKEITTDLYYDLLDKYVQLKADFELEKFEHGKHMFEAKQFRTLMNDHLSKNQKIKNYHDDIISKVLFYLRQKELSRGELINKVSELKIK